MLEKAIKLAEDAHRGQLDKGGQPYILHVKRVMEKCKTEQEKVTAVLHDVLEDTPCTLEELRKEGISEEILEALVCLSRKEEEPYMVYIERVCKNPLAVRVKYADMEDNMDLCRIPTPTAKDFARQEKYKAAKARLERALRR